jgi:hypothetical protein
MIALTFRADWLSVAAFKHFIYFAAIIIVEFCIIGCHINTTGKDGTGI